MTTMHPLLARFHNEPALVDETSHALFTSLLAQVAAHPQLNDLTAAVSNDDGFWPAADDWRARYRPYVVRDGVLQIPVKGVLLNEFPFALGDWATGYEYIQRAFERGCEDYAAGNIKGIALVINSPGGMVAGCFDAADKCLAFKAESGVPVRAFAAEHAFSAAYVWACVGDTITVSRTGGVGSIGVVTMHVDRSGAMDKAGIKVTFIHAGAHKVDGNPYESLSDEVKARIQTRIDELYSIFVTHVAANRPLDEAAVRATEALTFTASESTSNGLADQIGALDDALAAFAVELSTNSQGEDEMSTNTDNSASEEAVEIPTVDTAQIAADAVAADRQRRRDIMGCDEAKDRQTLATHLADSTDLSVDAAKGILAASAVETAGAVAATMETTPFVQQMDAEEQPNVGASGASGENDDDADDGADVVALGAAMGLKGFAKQA